MTADNLTPATALTDSRRLRVRCECGVTLRIPRLPFGCSCGRIVTTAEDVGESPFEPRTVTLPPPHVPKGFGPGTELQRILSDLGAFLHRFLPFTRQWRINHLDCGCGNYIDLMDDWGPAGCREWFPTIVGWLENSAVKQGWIPPLVSERPFLLPALLHRATRTAAAVLLERAIRRAEQNHRGLATVTAAENA